LWITSHYTNLPFVLPRWAIPSPRDFTEPPFLKLCEKAPAFSFAAPVFSAARDVSAFILAADPRKSASQSSYSAELLDEADAGFALGLGVAAEDFAAGADDAGADDAGFGAGLFDVAAFAAVAAFVGAAFTGAGGPTGDNPSPG
jgi:hypothetical protein